MHKSTKTLHLERSIKGDLMQTKKLVVMSFLAIAITAILTSNAVAANTVSVDVQEFQQGLLENVKITKISDPANNKTLGLKLSGMHAQYPRIFALSSQDVKKGNLHLITLEAHKLCQIIGLRSAVIAKDSMETTPALEMETLLRVNSKNNELSLNIKTSKKSKETDFYFDIYMWEDVLKPVTRNKKVFFDLVFESVSCYY